MDKWGTGVYLKNFPPIPEGRNVDRFWSYVLKEHPLDCWPWRTRRRAIFWWWGADGERYHQIVTRVAYRVSRGEIPYNCVVAHACDNGRIGCCRPDHLEAITQYQNRQDAIDRRRVPVPRAKLTEGQVRAIRAAFNAGITHESLAKTYGISLATVSGIRTGRVWRSVQ